jgi:hypothetical protein
MAARTLLARPPKKNTIYNLSFCHCFIGVAEDIFLLLDSGKAYPVNLPASQAPPPAEAAGNSTRRRKMAEHMAPQTVITTEEALRTEILLNQALIDILIAKRLISEEELISSMQKIKNEREILTEDWESLS